MIRYGKTFWGNKFVETFNNLEGTNKINPGRYYANNDLIKKITVENNTIDCKVLGGRSVPFQLKYSFPTFTKEQKETILNILFNNPIYVAMLLNNKLPEELYEILKEKNIPLYPKKWFDLRIQCDCEELMMPCKHVASTFFPLAREIDYDPFFYFKLKGLDIREELKKRKYKVEECVIKEWKDCFSKELIVSKSSNVRAAVRKLDFTNLPDLEQKLIEITEPDPPFYGKDLKTELLHSFKQFIKLSHKYKYENYETEQIDLESTEIEAITLDEHTHTMYVKLKLENEIKHFSFFELFYLFENFDKASLTTVTNSLFLAFNAYIFAKNLLQNGLLAPSLYHMKFNLPDDNTYYLMWCPLINDKLVAEQLQILNEVSGALKIEHIESSGKVLYCKPEYFANLLVSIFATHIIEALFIEYTEDKNTDDFLDFIFGKAKLVDEIKPKTAQSIQNWLKIFEEKRTKYQPFIFIEENVNAFNFKLLFQSLEDKTSFLSLNEIKEKDYFDYIYVLKENLYAASFDQNIKNLLYNPENAAITINKKKFLEYYFETKPILERLGFNFELKTAEIVKPEVILYVDLTREKRSVDSYYNLYPFLNYQWKIRIKDKLLDPKDLLPKLNENEGVYKFDEYWICTTNNELTKLEKICNSTIRVTKTSNLFLILSRNYLGLNVVFSEQVEKILDKLNTPPEHPLPKRISNNLILQPHQIEIYNWLNRNINNAFGNIINASAGIGKSIAILLLIQKLHEEDGLAKHKVLIVTKYFKIKHWETIIKKYFPDLTSYNHCGEDRTIKTIFDAEITITTYEHFKEDFTKLNSLRWVLLVADEIQSLSYFDMECSSGLKTLPALYKIAVSSTPILDNLIDFWNIFDLMNKNFFGNLQTFTNDFINEIIFKKSKAKLQTLKLAQSLFVWGKENINKTVSIKYTELTRIQLENYNQLTKPSSKIDYENEEWVRKVKKNSLCPSLINNICEDEHKSNKMLYLLNIIASLFHHRQSIIVISEFSDVLNLIKEKILKYQKIHTYTILENQKNNQEQLELWLEEKNSSVLLVQSKINNNISNLPEAENYLFADPIIDKPENAKKIFTLLKNIPSKVHLIINSDTLEEEILNLCNFK